MPAERDPRLDPKPGDVLQRKTVCRRVETAGAELMIISVQHRRNIYLANTTIAWWRKWAATAEVIKRAEEQS